MNYLSAFLLHREAQRNGLPSSQNKKTLCFHSTSHSEVNSPGNFLHEAHVTLMPHPGIVYLPGWYWPLCVVSWRTRFVPCLEGMLSRSADGLLITASSPSYLTIPSLYEQLFPSLQCCPTGLVVFLLPFCLHRT